MKRCPECRRDYYDETLLYCLDDGSALLDGPGGIHATDAPSYGYEPATVMIHSTQPADATPTQVFGGQAAPADNTNAIAVLPFANMSPNEDAEYLSDGLAEELLNVLSRIQGLRVAGRTSAFSFKGKQTTFAEIGRQLNVSSVLEGSVRMAGKRVRIAVQLVNVANGYHLWSETYDRTMDDIFAIQDDIANSVVEELRSRLGTGQTADLSTRVAAEVAGAAKGRPEDPEAHRLMLLGRHLAERRTGDDLAKAVEYFDQVLAIDPQNAQCWAEKGALQVFLAGLGFISYDDGYASARTAAETALRLEPDLAAGHALLGRIKLYRDRDFRSADESIKRALALGPENIVVLQIAGFVLRTLGQLDESIEIAYNLLTMDPLNAVSLQLLGNSTFSSGMFDEAETAIRRSIEITPSGVYKRALLAKILAKKGQFGAAKAEAEREPDRIWGLWAMAFVEIEAGNIVEAEVLLDLLIEKDPAGAAFQIAEIYAALGQTDKAFEYLDAGIETDPGTVGLLASLPLRSLHSDSRWPSLLRKIGIPEEYWPEI